MLPSSPNKIYDTSHPDTILITGGCGFIGLNLVNYLLKNGSYYIRILDDLSIGRLDHLKEIATSHNSHLRTINLGTKPKNLPPAEYQPSTVDLYIGDIRSFDTCIKAMEGIDAVVHLAAHAGVVPSIENPRFDFEVNALGTLNLLQASVQKGVKKFIFASSNAPLGEHHPPMNENKVPRPLSPYGASKLACEGYCIAFYASYGLKTIILRFSNVYGPYSLHKNSVIARFIKDGMLKGVLTIYGDGSQTRDFIHVDDLSHAISLILTPLILNPGIWGETFHLGTAKETSIINLAHYVRELSGGDVKIAFESKRKGEIKRNYSDLSKAQAMLGFAPVVRLEDGIRKVYEWFMEQRIDSIRNAHVLSGSE